MRVGVARHLAVQLQRHLVALVGREGADPRFGERAARAVARLVGMQEEHGSRRWTRSGRQSDGLRVEEGLHCFGREFIIEVDIVEDGWALFFLDGSVLVAELVEGHGYA